MSRLQPKAIKFNHVEDNKAQPNLHQLNATLSAFRGPLALRGPMWRCTGSTMALTRVFCGMAKPSRGREVQARTKCLYMKNPLVAFASSQLRSALLSAAAAGTPHTLVLRGAMSALGPYTTSIHSMRKLLSTVLWLTFLLLSCSSETTCLCP